MKKLKELMTRTDVAESIRMNADADKLRGQWLDEDASTALVGYECYTRLTKAMNSVGLHHCGACHLWTDAPFFDADDICESCVAEFDEGES